MTTMETIAKIHATKSQAKAEEIAFSACKTWMDEDQVAANGADNGWSTIAIYDMPDGGRIRQDGRGWLATLPNGQEIHQRG